MVGNETGAQGRRRGAGASRQEIIEEGRMKITSWNVNSLKVRLPQVLEFLAQHKPDALCLQELKLEDVNFPSGEINRAGYQAVFSGQKTYNGVAILSPTLPSDVSLGILDYDDPQKRVIGATVNGVRIVCVYIPNGESVESEKYKYKLDWLMRLVAWLKQELVKYPKLALLGDYNIAPEDRDVHDPKFWTGKVLFSEPEKAAFREMVALGLTDSFRLFEQPEKSYSWWDYRMNGFKRNLGLRIDHILLSPELAKGCKSCSIDRDFRAKERPSDHAPVIAELEI
jgi:exodeoxyribonuclease-3